MGVRGHTRIQPEVLYLTTNQTADKSIDIQQQLAKCRSLSQRKNIKTIILLWFCSALQICSSESWPDCILSSPKSVVSLAVCPVNEFNLSFCNILIIGKYLVKGSCDQAFAFLWFMYYLHKLFIIANSCLKCVGCLSSMIARLLIFKENKQSHRQ